MRRLWIALGGMALVWAAEEKPPSLPLTTTERLALTSLSERGRLLQQDTQAFYTEVCGRRSIKIEECNIDSAAMTISRVIKPPEPAK